MSRGKSGIPLWIEELVKIIQDGYAVRNILVSRSTYIGALGLSAAAAKMGLNMLPFHKNRLVAEGESY